MHENLRALRACEVQVFEGVHGWVDDASIGHELRHGDDQDLRAPHAADTNRAARIATVARALRRGVVFDALYLRVREHEVQPVELHLADGHHRLRVVEYHAAFGGSPELLFHLGGPLPAIRRLRAMLLR